MSKTVKFDSKDTKLDHDIVVMDSVSNVKMVANRVEKLLNAVDDLETKKAEENGSISLPDYIGVINPEIIAGFSELAGLTKTEQKLLNDISFSEIRDFYSEVVDKFLDMQLLTGKVIGDAMRNNNNTTSENENEGSEDPKLHVAE